METQEPRLDAEQAKGLLESKTSAYNGPTNAEGLTYSIAWRRQQPFIKEIHIPMMLRDPNVVFGLKLIKGPMLSKTEFDVSADDEGMVEFIQRQLKKWWTCAANITLDSIIYGYGGFEVLYEFNPDERTIELRGMKSFHPRDTRAITNRGKLVGMQVRGIEGREEPLNLMLPKAFWAVHQQHISHWYGRSLLEGAFEPWWETWQQDGYKDTRRLWFFKNAFNSGVLHYPQGSMFDENGVEVDNSETAMRIMDKGRSGAGLVLPKGDSEANSWDYEPPKGISVPQGLMDYGDDLKREVWAGMGIPPEVIESDGTGAFAGRKVPMLGFYSTLQSTVNEHFVQFNEQILKPLVKLAYGETSRYEAYPVSILDVLRREELESITGGGFGDPEEGAASGVDREPNEHNQEEAEITAAQGKKNAQ